MNEDFRNLCSITTYRTITYFNSKYIHISASFNLFGMEIREYEGYISQLSVIITV